jgi:methyl-accepting chemotaxis protein
MDSINTTVNGLSAAIEGLGHRSDEIGQIIDSITAIASQTNLLALNAAIEAARAGDQGRGFAVVADEVRKLAEESAQSAKQIAGLISAIQAETTQAVKSMESATNEVQDGLQVVHTAGDSFSQLTSAISDVTSQIQEVSDTISESAAANTENVSAASEEQMAAMEEIASSAESLSKMAADLQRLTQKFKA